LTQGAPVKGIIGKLVKVQRCPRNGKWDVSIIKPLCNRHGKAIDMGSHKPGDRPWN